MQVPFVTKEGITNPNVWLMMVLATDSAQAGLRCSTGMTRESMLNLISSRKRKGAVGVDWNKIVRE